MSSLVHDRPLSSWSSLFTDDRFFRSAEDVFEDGYALSSLSLTCRTLKTVVQPQLFKHIHFTASVYDRTLTAFANFLHDHPHLAKCVDTLELRGRQPLPLPCLSLHLLYHILVHTRNIATLDVASFEWHTSRVCYNPWTPRLRHFIIRSIFVNSGATSPLHMLLGVPSCTSLRLHDVNHIGEPRVRDDVIFPVQTLAIVHDTHGGPARIAPRARSVFTSVRHFSVQGAELYHALVVYRVLVSATATLHTLSISFSEFQYCTS